ncbi:aromatic ring-hydroxylating oxygenase subunit alpha [Sphingopyxis terrae]|uniref:aromatic ring-hydroxylating oxygenase subunit alpha n=1 Tax=Sphingopyxis terrae TaxID=33052 RepID=UPI002A0FD606|nr:aromatic ring-hydroxylating dioxygenase subunit alpha [Sphingopyxis terrae]MDX8356496.1 aromatic ring-hydroxylating dioxygenase subunit alpha [Sphingopyxis terrae]
MKSDNAELLSAIGRQRDGWCLEQAFYTSDEIFEFERKHFFSRQWAVVAHASELPRKGDHIVRSLFGEEIIIVRASSEGDFRAYFNVCPHRGSRICSKDGRAPLLVCPYHAWSFKLTGEMQNRREVPEGADPDELGLRPVPIAVTGSMILCGLDAEMLPDPQPAVEGMLPILRRHGIDTAKIALRKTYPTNANWKLVIENFFECYHCRPAHPEYFRTNGHVKVSAMRDEAAAASWNEQLESWNAKFGENGRSLSPSYGDSLDRIAFGFYRKPIGDGRKSLSSDGGPVSKLMGEFTEYDGAETGMRLGRLSFVSAANDHATLFQFIPTGARSTDVIITWLVAPDAEPDPDAVSWMWDVTTVQDKQIVEENAKGVQSMAYRPGPYTDLETQTASFIRTYLSEMKEMAGGTAAS